MNYKRILISEAEKRRILGAHKSYAKRNNLNFGRLNEATDKVLGRTSDSIKLVGGKNGEYEITIPSGSKITGVEKGGNPGGYSELTISGKEKNKLGNINLRMVCSHGVLPYYFSFKDETKTNYYGNPESFNASGDQQKVTNLGIKYCKGDGKGFNEVKPEENQNKNTNTNWTQPPSLQNVLAGTSVIKTGMMGDSIGKIQEILKNGKDANGPLYDGNIDNKYGSKTKDAVVKFQKIAFPDDPTQWDGIVGKNTLTLLNKEGKDNNIDLGLSQTSGENTQTKQNTTPESANQQQINQSVEQEDITISFIEPTF